MLRSLSSDNIISHCTWQPRSKCTLTFHGSSRSAWTPSWLAQSSMHCQILHNIFSNIYGDILVKASSLTTVTGGWCCTQMLAFFLFSNSSQECSTWDCEGAVVVVRKMLNHDQSTDVGMLNWWNHTNMAQKVLAYYLTDNTPVCHFRY